MSLKIVAATAVEYDVASEPIASITLDIRNQATDRLTIVLDMQAAGTLPAWAVETANIKLMRDTTVIFAGHLQWARRDGNIAQQVVLEVLSPWDLIENTPFTQTYTDAITGSTLSSADYSFNATTTVAQRVSAALTAATTLFPTAIAAGTIDLPTIQPPASRSCNRTIADVLRETLRYIPGCITFFEYSQTPPKLHILKPDSTHLGNIDTSAGALVFQRDISQQVSGVILLYERDYELYDGAGELISSGKIRVAKDAYPAETTTNHKVLTRTQLLSGVLRKRQISYTCRAIVNQNIEFRTAHTDDPRVFPSAGELLHFMGIPVYEVSYTTIYNGVTISHNTHAPDPAFPICGGASFSSFLSLNPSLWPGSYPNFDYCYCISPILDGGGPPPDELLDNPSIWFGTCNFVTGWVASLDGPVHVNHTTIFCGLSSSSTNPNNITISKAVTDTSGALQAAPAAGAAQALYTSLASHSYAGTLSVESASPPVLNPFVRRYVRSGINVPVQSIGQDFVSGSTIYNFGPPSHLSPQDFLDLLNKS